MFYVKIDKQTGKAIRVQREFPGGDDAFTTRGWTNRNDWPTMADAERIAKELNEVAGYQRFVATDAGPYTSPRYDICEIPRVGDKVSKYFNGDSYPCGEVASISKSLKLVTTTDGTKFYRHRQSGLWINEGTWALMAGHHNLRNPHF
jgi:hypothetical protein